MPSDLVERERPATATTPSTSPLTVGLCIAVTAIAFEAIAVATAMPAAARELGQLGWYAWAYSIFQVGVLVSTVVAGRLCDALGPVRPIIAGMIIFTVGLVLAGTAPVMAQLIAGRAVQGVGAGMMNVALYVVIARAYPPASRAQMMTWISTAWVMPAFVGPPIAALLTTHLSWHWVFFAVIPLLVLTGALTLPILLRLRRSGLDDGHEVNDPAPIWAAVLMAAAIPLLQYAGQRLDVWSLPFAAVAVVLVAVALPRLMPPGFVRLRRGIASVVMARGVIAGGYFAAEAFIPLMLVETRDLPLFWAGAVLTVGAVGWTTGSFVQSRRRLPLTRPQIMTLGTILISTGLFAIAVVTVCAQLPQPVGLGLVVVSWVVGGLGMGLAHASTSLLTMQLSSDASQGRNASSLQVADALCAAVFTALAGTIFAGLSSPAAAARPAAPYVFAATLLVPAVLSLAAIATSRRVGPVPTHS